MSEAVLNDILDLEEWLDFVGSGLAFSGNQDLINTFNGGNVAILTVSEFLALIDLAEQVILSIDWQVLIDEVAALLNNPLFAGELTDGDIQEILQALNEIDPSEIREGFDLLRAEFQGIDGDTILVEALQIAGGAPQGSPDADVLVGTPGSDEVALGAGDDSFAAGPGDVGNDTIRGGGGDDTINGGGGRDVLFGGGGQDVVRGGGGADVIRGGLQADVLIGAKGSDTLFGERGADQLLGGGARDRLVGGRGEDTLFGGAGNDRLIGGLGDDSMKGGAGADIFIFRGNFGNDTIDGFAANNDAEKLDLRTLVAFDDFADLQSNHLQQVGDDAVISDGSGNSITLLNVDIADLGAEDFIF
ncbi:calcium-binding protein [Phaeobacter sp.]|uniref:calcium-binding protein n=1 Tax=Phaeobacter sp. TaxID=1902409 RepID=UPI0025D4C9E8|nr:calcium-binding protein [Phaeobacter sp.]